MIFNDRERKSKYDDFLAKYAGDNELLELIKWCVLDWEETKENYYQNYGKYPEQRNLLIKLKFDLVNKKNEIIESMKGE
ncbi:hypothetical protein [Fusobacterium polymorphum]|uniref:hypothetical protein n=1 Tax=Fusobacterium nucleatum subsp. polymorphum TaxID=76857 RepID=UPI002051D2CA|nr:MAG TPA: hypothetical protein [Caudoviricetes sp.]